MRQSDLPPPPDPPPATGRQPAVTDWEPLDARSRSGSRSEVEGEIEVEAEVVAHSRETPAALAPAEDDGRFAPDLLAGYGLDLLRRVERLYPEVDVPLIAAKCLGLDTPKTAIWG